MVFINKKWRPQFFIWNGYQVHGGTRPLEKRDKSAPHSSFNTLPLQAWLQGQELASQLRVTESPLPPNMSHMPFNSIMLFHSMESRKFSWVPRVPFLKMQILLRWLSYHYLFNRTELTVTRSKMALRTRIMDERAPKVLERWWGMETDSDNSALYVSQYFPCRILISSIT